MPDHITGQLTKYPKKMADIPNRYYIDKIMNERPKPQQDGLTFCLVSPDPVNKIIKDLRSSKSYGLDGLGTHIIKLVWSFIVPAVTHIINTSI